MVEVLELITDVPFDILHGGLFAPVEPAFNFLDAFGMRQAFLKLVHKRAFNLIGNSAPSKELTVLLVGKP